MNVIAAELLPDGYRYWVLFTEADAHSDTGPVPIADFEDLRRVAGLDRTCSFSDLLMAGLRLSEGDFCIAADVAEALRSVSPPTDPLLVRHRSYENEIWVWAISPVSFLGSAWPLEPFPDPFGEFEVLEGSGRWYMRFIDSEPFALLAVDEDIDSSLVGLSSPVAMRVSAEEVVRNLRPDLLPG